MRLANAAFGTDGEGCAVNYIRSERGEAVRSRRGQENPVHDASDRDMQMQVLEWLAEPCLACLALESLPRGKHGACGTRAIGGLHPLLPSL